MASGQLCETDTADPWMIKFNNKYLLTFTTGGNIVLWSSPLLQDFHNGSATKQERILWYFPPLRR